MHLHMLQDVQIGRKRSQWLAIVRIRSRNLDLFERIQDIKFGEIDGIVPVDGVGVFDHHQIQPSTATLTAGSNANFAADLLKFLTVFVELLGWEWTAADTGRVCFDDTDGFADSLWAEMQARENTSKASVGRRNVGVGSSVDIQHSRLRAFDENVHVAFDHGLDERNLINHKGFEGVPICVEACNFFFHIVLKEITIALLEARGHLADLAVKEVLVEDLRDVNARASGLGGICRPNAFASRANVFLAQLDFFETVNFGMQVEINVAAVTNEYAVIVSDAMLFQILNLLEEAWDVEDTASADEVDAAFCQDTRGLS
jgi:hypothetical protein